MVNAEFVHLFYCCDVTSLIIFFKFIVFSTV